MRIENMKKRQSEGDEYDPYTVPDKGMRNLLNGGATFKEHRKSQDQTRKSHSIFTSNNDFIALNKNNRNDELDNFKSLIKSSSVFVG